MAETKYSWKIEKYPISAETAADELQRIYDKYGELTKANVVDESEDETAVLHGCFEWDDKKAARRYREEQAGDLMRCLVSVEVPDNAAEPVVVRAIVKTTEKYEPVSVSLRVPEKRAVLLAEALQDAENYKRKYSVLSELADVFAAMDKVAEAAS